MKPKRKGWLLYGKRATEEVPIKQGLKPNSVRARAKVCGATEEVPIKQGLKHISSSSETGAGVATEEVPIKQGLKLSIINTLDVSFNATEEVPIKQGLKHIRTQIFFSTFGRYRRSSNKTRIETLHQQIPRIDPSQGYRRSSNKTRIETSI